MTLDQKRLEATMINGWDAIFLLTNIAVETVVSTSATKEEVDERLGDMANRLKTVENRLPESQSRFLVGQLAIALMGTEWPK